MPGTPLSTDSHTRQTRRHRAPRASRRPVTGGAIRERLLPLGGGVLASGLLIGLATGATGGAVSSAAEPMAPVADVRQAAALETAANGRVIAAGKKAQAAAAEAARVQKIAAANRAARAEQAARATRIAAANRAARAEQRAEAARRGPEAPTKNSPPERRSGRTMTVSGPSGAKSLASAMVADRGWGAGEFRCLERLWEKESNWRHTARNASSGAYGIPQSLPGHKMASAGSDWRTNPATQIRWGLDYIADRYDRPCNAWGHSQRNNWY